MFLHSADAQTHSKKQGACKSKSLYHFTELPINTSTKKKKKERKKEKESKTARFPVPEFDGVGPTVPAPLNTLEIIQQS